jgi:hypothetical protein
MLSSAGNNTSEKILASAALCLAQYYRSICVLFAEDIYRKQSAAF